MKGERNMKTPLSPNDIEVLIRCHCRHDEPHPRVEARAVQEALRMWKDAGMIECSNSDDSYSTTDKGHAMIEALCNTPEPHPQWSCVWVDQTGRILLMTKDERGRDGQA